MFSFSTAQSGSVGFLCYRLSHANNMHMRHRKLHIWLFWEETAAHIIHEGASHDQTHVTDVLGVVSGQSDLWSVSNR